jgi:hypothetical protein
LEVANYQIVEPGIVIFQTPPSEGQVVAWSGSFLFRCEFTQDRFDAQQLNALLWSSDGLQFQTVRI